MNHPPPLHLPLSTEYEPFSPSPYYTVLLLTKSARCHEALGVCSPWLLDWSAWDMCVGLPVPLSLWWHWAGLCFLLGAWARQCFLMPLELTDLVRLAGYQVLGCPRTLSASQVLVFLLMWVWGPSLHACVALTSCTATTLQIPRIFCRALVVCTMMIQKFLQA